MEDVHFNSTRIAGTDRLDSSDVELCFHVSDAFVRCVSAWQSSHRGESGGLDAALAACVSCEVLFFDGGLPTVFVEEEDVCTGAMQYRMSSIPPPKLRCAYTESRRQLRVWVERKMPLSSSHGGRRFILAFVLGKDEVVRTRPFLVFAKKAKEGVGSKFKYQPTFLEVDARRAGVLQRLQDTFGAQEGRSAWEQGLAAAATAAAGSISEGEGHHVVVPAHPLVRALHSSHKDNALKRAHAVSTRATRSSGEVPATSTATKRAKVSSSDCEPTPPSVTSLDLPNSEKWLLENDLADVYGVDAECAAPGTGMRVCSSPSPSPSSAPASSSPSPVSEGASLSPCKLKAAVDAANEDAFGGLLDDFDCDLSTPMVEQLFEREAEEDIAAFCGGEECEAVDALDFDRLFA